MKRQTNGFKQICILMAVIIFITTFSSCNSSDSTSSEIISSSDSSFESEYISEDSSQLISDIESDIDMSDISSDFESSSPDESEDVSDDENSSSSEDLPSDEPIVEKEDRAKAFRISSLDDVTDKEGQRSYTVYAPYTDEYSLSGVNTASISISKNGKVLQSGEEKLSVSLKKNEAYTLTVATKDANSDFKITTTAKNHLVTLPYDVAPAEDISGISLSNNNGNPLTPAEVDYIKREGGTYIYSNNPEMFGAQHVGKAFMRNDGLKGEVYVTFEHANYSGKNAYLGYQLKNNTDHDVYITITNVGYQWIGTWFGQLAWYDFYNTSFKLPSDYFTSTGAISPKYSGLDYAYKNYTPRVYQPTTYRLPAGEYFWVIGGTSSDAYRNINVDKSANHFVNPVRCANGNVKFTVTGGEVSGTMYCYTNPDQIKNDPKPIGYVGGNYAQQYSGIAHHHGVIDNYMSWTFNDNVGSGMLPVTYTNYYNANVPAKTTPYTDYHSTAHTVSKSNTWMTHLNPQNNHQAVGMDMVEFIWHDSFGREVVIDNNHADASGAPANTANWMIEYQDHFTFVNQGDKDRKVTLHLRDHGTLAILVRDSKSGAVLSADYTAGLGASGSAFSNYQYEITIPAHSVKQITLDYLLVACSYGSVNHAVALK